MAKTPISAPDRGTEGGFSLLELLIVIALLGVLGGLGAQALPSWRHSPTMLRAGLSKVLQDARHRSIQTGVAVAVDCRTLEEKLVDLLKKNVSEIRFECGSTVSSSSGNGAIVFHPDGSSSGGSVSFELEQREHLDVDWFTGQLIWE